MINFLLQKKWNNFSLKTLDVDHMLIVKKFEKEVNNSIKQTKERHLTKKILNISRRSISKKNLL